MSLEAVIFLWIFSILIVGIVAFASGVEYMRHKAIKMGYASYRWSRWRNTHVFTWKNEKGNG